MSDNPSDAPDMGETPGQFFGKNFIQERRKALEITQEEIANEMGVHKVSVGRWEKEGNLTVAQLGQLATLLNCTPAELVPGPPAPAALTTDEEQLLAWFRAAGDFGRRSITIQARGAAELANPELSPTKRDAG